MAETSRHPQLELSRGDVVVSAAPGDFGKPRPALVVQSDLFNPTHASIVICPITSHLVDAPLFRPTIPPTRANGLKAESQIMVDEITAIYHERIGKRIGRLSDSELARVDRALLVWLGINVPGRLAVYYRRLNVTTACASADRPSPTGPTFSAVLNFTETRSSVQPHVVARLSRMAPR